MKRIVIIGSGGHGRVVANIAELNGYKEIVLLDDDISKEGVCGRVDEYEKYLDTADFFVAIGDSHAREKIYLMLKEKNATVITLIHPRATVCGNVTLGKGTVIMAGAVVNVGVEIGNGVIVNTNSVIEHDCSVNDFSHISVGSGVCGGVSVGKHTWIGAGATVINNVEICDNCMIGAGSTVVKNIILEGVYVGTPARKHYRRSYNFE